MERREYLEKNWRPYPEAEEHWQDVDAFLRANGREGAVCGRLQKDDGTCFLQANGARIPFVFVSNLDRSGFSPDLLEEGDLLCLELRWINGAFEATAARLLVPSAGSFNLPSAYTVARSRLWSDFTFALREFFRARDFIEAQTPTLVPSPGTEPFLDPFTTEWSYGDKRTRFYLPTSPEFHLKKLLAAGWTRVFELKTCFRNGEIGSHHQPEFTMLEWYRGYATLDAIADDLEALIAELAARFGREQALTMHRTTMAELFSQHFGGFILRPDTSRDEIKALASRHTVRIETDDSWDEIFFRLFLEKIEPGLGADGPVLVRGYPPSQAALSRIGQDGFADRFELYWQGLEIANAFHELNNARENAARFESDARDKERLGKAKVPVDEELLKALSFGLPPSGGIALGVDRLFMALFDISAIADTRAFPLLK